MDWQEWTGHGQTGRSGKEPHGGLVAGWWSAVVLQRLPIGLQAAGSTANQEGAPPRTGKSEADKRPVDRTVAWSWLPYLVYLAHLRPPRTHWQRQTRSLPTDPHSLRLSLPVSIPLCLNARLFASLFRFLHLTTWLRARNSSSRDLSPRLDGLRSPCIGIHGDIEASHQAA